MEGKLSSLWCWHRAGCAAERLDLVINSIEHCKHNYFANSRVIMSQAAGAGRDGPFVFKSPMAVCLMFVFG